jgi:predicted nucleic acid-binding protein
MDRRRQERLTTDSPFARPLRPTLLDAAELRSLDALHLATIVSLGGDLERLYCYDSRLRDAAQALGIEVSQPH